MRNVLDRKCRDNQNTHFAFNNFFPESRAVYETRGEIKQNALLLFHCNNDYAVAPPCYVIHTRPLLLKIYSNFNHNFTI